MSNEPQNETAPAALYPAFLKLAGRPVLLVGGGPIAFGKLAGLRAAGARVTVVAPAVDPRLRAAAGRDAEILVHERAFSPSDLDGAWFVVAAAPPEVNRAVAAAAEARHLFVNAVDDLASATAYLGGVVRRGDVTFAISTGGDAPALAGLLREALDALLPAELSDWLAEARVQRTAWRAAGVPMEARRPLLLAALNRLYAAAPEAGP